MNQEELRKKYCNHSIVIPIPYWRGKDCDAKEVFEEMGLVKNVFEEIGLKVVITEIVNPGHLPSKLLLISDPLEEYKENISFNGSFNFSTFCKDASDFAHEYQVSKDKEQYVVAENVLKKLNIKTESISRSRAEIKDLIEQGFIQVNTSVETSLWWNKEGIRVLFICGRGAFTLSKLVVNE